MDDLQTLVQREMDRAGSPGYSFEDLGHRRDRKRRNQRITAGVVGIIVALLSLATLARAFLGGQRPANEPTPSPSPDSIFADVDGWIVYGDWRLPNGIWAVNPTRPGDPRDQIQLSEREGEPLGWSSDGSKLLIRRPVPDPNRGPVANLDLFILNADGTETRVTRERNWITGSISPDGSEVVYVAGFDGHMYTVDAEGGEPRLLLASARRSFRNPAGGTVRFRSLLYNPTFSPDGTQIAYFDGGGDHSHSLRVMNTDGSGVRILIDQAPEEVGHVENLVWSPDGSRLAFSAEEGGIWIVGVDGSGLMKAVPNGSNVHWSPDGSRISYQSVGAVGLGALEISTLDGRHIQEFGYGGSGPWNPLPLSVPSNHGATATAERGYAGPFVSILALLAVVGTVVLFRRSRRKITEP
jgi:dipeptidyl aminopeptidase/acylaminoacyl peptidase